MDDLHRQNDEIEVLKSIYDDDLTLSSKWQNSGCLKISPAPYDEFFMLYVSTEIGQQISNEILRLSYLPPIELFFKCPSNYPSTSQPFFMLKCDWMSDENLSSLSYKLDSIWDGHLEEILYEWAVFLKERCLRFLSLGSINISIDLSVSNPICPSLPSNLPNLRFRELPSRTSIKNHNEVSHTRKNKSMKAGIFKYETPKDIQIQCETVPHIKDKQNVEQTNSSDMFAKQNSFLEQILEHIDFYGKRQYTSMISDCRVISEVQDLSNSRSKITLVNKLSDYNEECLKKEFRNEWHECGVCFDQKKGLECLKLLACSHTYCLVCVEEYLKINIRDGNILNLQCLSLNCDTLFKPAQIQEIVSQEMFKKYQAFSQKLSIENDPSLMYCPRTICQSVARRFSELSQDICYCSRCSYFFCAYCKKAYHGVQPCALKNEERMGVIMEYQSATAERQAELEKRYSKQLILTWINDNLSVEWLQTQTKPCPNCFAPIQKTDGCNKMMCFKCQNPFCWLCFKILPRLTPYDHFTRDRNSSCYQKLFPDYETDEFAHHNINYLLDFEDEDYEDNNYFIIPDEDYD